jgi:pimeloyl-ACP methyl ester carboxylesterase
MMLKNWMVLGLAFCLSAGAHAEIWTPEKTSEQLHMGRRLEVYTNGVKEAWGYAEPQKDAFLVLHPKQARRHAPLYVVLHSAGHDVYSCLKCTLTPGNHDIYHAPADFFALYLDCRGNKGDWWWGIQSYKGPDVSPTERRVIDTVKWVIEAYAIDPHRVYLCGNSMGGSGTLGIGMRHGDVFAAIKANVPARVEHVSSRMGFPPYAALPAGMRLADPPVCIDYSAPNDSWSTNHEAFVNVMNARKYPLYFYWGPFGHANNDEKILAVNDLVHSFDWLGVRKNELYAVFTDASTNDPLPWPERLDDKRPGQVNAFFRWKPLADRRRQAAVSLFLLTPQMIKTAFALPEEATATVTLRRLQRFSVNPGEEVRWSFGARSGTIHADAEGLVTIPGLTITGEPQALRVSKPGWRFW